MRACIYARKSTNKLAQKETIDTQISICKHSSTNYGIDIVDIKTDIGTATDDINRPEVHNLIDDAINGKYECIIMKGISRFYRDVEKGLALIKMFHRHNIRVITLEESFDSLKDRTGNGKLDTSKITMYLMFAEMESKKTADRVKYQQLDKARKGQWNNSRTPFGYKYDSTTKKLTPDFVAAQIVKMIFDMYENGYGTRRLALYLRGENEDNNVYKSPSASWNVNAVAYILKNRAYVGDIIYNVRSSKENIYKRKDAPRNHDRDSWTGNAKNDESNWVIVENAHEAIIDRDQFNRVQDLLEAKTNNKGIRQNFSLFAGLLKCGVCDKGMSLKKKLKVEHYFCGQYVKYGVKGCSGHNVKLLELEKVIVDRLLSFHNNEEILKEFIRKHHGVTKSIQKSNQNDRKKIEELIKNVADKMDKLLEKNMNGEISDSQFTMMNNRYAKELDDYTNNLSEYPVEVESTYNEDEVIDRYRSVLVKIVDYNTMDLEQKRAYLSLMINKIVVSKNSDGDIETKIQYNFKV